MIDLFGTVGGITEHRASLLASRGFAALALPYFGYEDLPKDLGLISLDYFIVRKILFVYFPRIFCKLNPFPLSTNQKRMTLKSYRQEYGQSLLMTV